MFTLLAYSSWALLALRLVVGAIFIVHGKMKWPMWSAQPSDQLPAEMLWKMKLLSVVEPLGGLALMFGFLTQWASFGFIIIMLGAIYHKINKWQVPFMSQDKTGWEFDLLILASSLTLLIVGPGIFSLDALLALLRFF